MAHVQRQTFSIPSIPTPSMSQPPGRPPGALNSSVSASPLGQAIHPPEIFIVVRPPPSKQNHPLNLQVQLFIPPITTNGATPASSLRRRSGDFSSGAGGVGDSGSGSLVRSPSLRSTRSGRSGSVGSLGSMGSTVTSSSSRRVVSTPSVSSSVCIVGMLVDVCCFGKLTTCMRVRPFFHPSDSALQPWISCSHGYLCH